MSFLPYDSGGPGSWVLAGGTSALTHGALIFVVIGGLQQMIAVQDTPDPRFRFQVTLEQLDSDTLAGIIEQQGVAGAEGAADSELEQVAPETPDANEPEQLAALTPEPEPEVVPEEAAVPDIPEPETPEPVAAEPEPELIPEEIAPVTAEAVPAPTASAEIAESLSAETLTALEPVAPEMAPTSPLDSPAIAPQTASPITSQSIAGTSSLSPTALAPVAAPVAAAGVASIQPTTQAPTAARPTEVARQVVAAVRPPAPEPPAPARAAAAPPAPQSAQDLAIGDLIQRIRSARADPCLLALPRRDGPDGVGLALISAEDGAMAQFAQDTLTAEDADIRQTRTLVDPRQCPALTYVRQNRDYPATRLGLALDANEVPSGGRLTGVLRGTAGRYVLLLLVDNNGVVQDLQRFLSFSGNFARFDVPVTRPGAPRDTSQVLLAIATDRPASTIRDRAGQLAQDVFAALQGQSATAAALAVATFDVR